MNELIDLSIIIVNWNSWEFLDKCIKSIEKNKGDLNIEIIIIDNASQDGSNRKILENYCWIKLISLKENIGFPKANNIGFNKAKGKYILALNPDTEIINDCLKKCVQFLDNQKDYGCVGVKLILPNGKIQYHSARTFPTLKSLIFGFLYLDKAFPKSKFLSSIDMTYWDHQTTKDVDMISGAFMLFRKEVYEKIGGFDERLSMYLEDMEYCLRINRNKYKIKYLADVETLHYVGRSSKKAPPLWIEKLRFEANYLFLKEYQGRKKSLYYCFIILILFPFRFFLIPLIWVGSKIKNNQNTFKKLFSSTLASFFWSFNKIIYLFINSIKNYFYMYLKLKD